MAHDVAADAPEKGGIGKEIQQHIGRGRITEQGKIDGSPIKTVLDVVKLAQNRPKCRRSTRVTLATSRATAKVSRMLNSGKIEP